MAAAVGMAEEQPPAQDGGWQEDAALHRLMGDLGGWGLSLYSGPFLPAPLSAEEGRSTCQVTLCV